MTKHYDVVKLFERFCLQMIERRHERFGINLIRERVRWETVYEYGAETYKFCNTFSPYVARHLLYVHPEWKPFIKCKRTQDERVVTLIPISEIFPEVAA